MKKLTIYLFVLCITLPIDARLADFSAKATTKAETSAIEKKRKKKKKNGKKKRRAKRPVNRF